MENNQRIDSIEEQIARVKEQDVGISAEKMETNQKKLHGENKKYILAFIVMIFVSGGLGYFVGAAAKAVKEGITVISLGKHIWQGLTVAAPFINLSLNLLALLAFVFLIVRSKKLLLTFDGENDKEERDINYLLNWVMLITQVLYIADLFLFAVEMHSILHNYVKEALCNIYFFSALGNLIVGLVLIMVAQYKAVEYTRLMNPEKKGNIFDRHFQRKFEASLDEAEIMTARKAGFKAYKRTTIVLLGMGFVCLVADVSFGVGMFPMVLISVVLLVHVLTYVVEVMRLER